MAQQTRAQLLDRAIVVKNETIDAANTALRVGSLLEDIADSFVHEDDPAGDGQLEYANTTGTVVNFDVPRQYGFNGTASTGNITFGFTDSKDYNIPKMLHNHTTVPTITGGVIVSGEYLINRDNILYFSMNRLPSSQISVYVTIVQLPV